MTTNLPGRAGFRVAFSGLMVLGLSLAPSVSAQDVPPDAETEASAPLLSAPIPWRLSADQEGVEGAAEAEPSVAQRLASLSLSPSLSRG